MEDVLTAIRKFWGFASLRPLQEEAIRAGLEKRDSLVVLPTGGGKSLCYQVPPVVLDRLHVVVSPLIALMKDQVDGLLQCGYPAAALHSNMAAAERNEVQRGLSEGRYRLLFVSPERLMAPGFLDRLADLGADAFAVDEAHCISHWGHDFRPEYRRLRSLREEIPGATIHAFTATATERVREDIVSQLGLENPRILVGTFDRENLVYRIVPGVDVHSQVRDILARHRGEAAIVYCLSRKDTESLAAALGRAGVKAAAYHAGLNREERSSTQEAFAKEELDVVVATVAFGMGIDRSDVRAVIHASLPRSIEHYQQETGRAGRDGLAAECVLLYSYSDVIRWQHLISMSASENEAAAEAMDAQLELLDEMKRFASVLQCRHRALSRHFGQDLASTDCGACDVCLKEATGMPDSTTVAQKILSCVARMGQRFGVGQLVKVLRGADVDTVRNRGHDQLSTFGILKDIPEKALTNLVYQLVDQGALGRTPGDRPVLTLTRDSLDILKGSRQVHLVQPAAARVKKSRAEAESWDDVDGGLFEHLRGIRRELATEQGVPPYVIFGDRTLRELAARQPTTEEEFATVHGVGKVKLSTLGPIFLAAIAAHREGNPS